MRELLNSRPNIDEYLKNVNVSDEQLAVLGIEKSTLSTLKDLTDLALLMRALKGDVKSKSYLDERFAKESQQYALNTEPRSLPTGAVWEEEK